ARGGRLHRDRATPQRAAPPRPRPPHPPRQRTLRGTRRRAATHHRRRATDHLTLTRRPPPSHPDQADPRPGAGVAQALSWIRSQANGKEQQLRAGFSTRHRKPQERRIDMSDKPDIVLVHGFWGGAAHWAKVIVELKGRGYDALHAV